VSGNQISKKVASMTYTCPICGNQYDSLPDIASNRPDQYWGIPERERSERVFLNSDICVIDNEDFFIRGVIKIPILGTSDNFGFGVWVSQKKENFQKYLDDPKSNEIGPFFGWLCTHLSYYREETFLLKTMAHFQAGNLRPLIELEPTAHPLSIDQKKGITLGKAWEIVHFYSDHPKPG
jgi:hypothetical protein